MSTSLLASPTVPDAFAGVHSLAQLRAAILADTTLSLRRQRDIASALRSLGQRLGRPLESIAAEPETVRRLLHGVTAAQMGFQPTRWRNVRSLVSDALAQAGRISVPGRIAQPPSPAWQALLALLTSYDTRCRMGRLARFCTGQGIAPKQVDDAVLTAFRAALDSGSLAADPARSQRETALHWNRAADAHPSWPQQRLSVPDNRLYYSPGWDRYPASLLADIAAWMATLSKDGTDDLLSDTALARPLRPATLRNRRAVLRLYLGALVLGGEDPASMLDLRSVVTPARAALALRFFLSKRADGKPSHHTAQIAQLVLGIARHWVKLSAAELQRLRILKGKVTPPRQGMTEHNKARLRPLQDDAVLGRVLRLPAELCHEVEQRVRVPGACNVTLARQWQTALLIELLLVFPMRMANLAGLRLGVQVQQAPQGEIFLVLGEDDTKNRLAMETALPERTARMLRRYLEHYRPLLGDAGSDWLFPGRGTGRGKGHDGLRAQISGILAERCGVAMHPHLFRHLAAMLTLRDNPGAYGLAQRILGHKSIETTTRFYTGMEVGEARRHYQQLVLAQGAAAEQASPARRKR
jgi:integrase